MSEMKFSCPHCEQHLSCDESLARASIQCPACQRPITVPPHAAERTSVSGPPVTTSPPSGSRVAAQQPAKRRLQPSGFEIALAIGAVAVVIGVGSFLLLNSRQASTRVVLSDQPGLRSIEISPDGKWIATGTWRFRDVIIWNARTGERLKTLPASGSTEVAFSPDGRWLAVSNAAECRLWDTADWQPAHTWPRNRAGDLQGPIAFSLDAHMLAIAHTREDLQLVEPASGNVLATLQPPTPRQPTWLCFTPDGGQLIGLVRSDALQVWDLRQIRSRLASMKLDWNLPSLPEVPKERAPALKVEVDLPTAQSRF